MSKKSKKKFVLDFEGIDILSKRFEDMGGDLKELADKALQETHAYVTPKVEQAMSASPYNFNRTGKTKGSLKRKAVVEWEGNVASVGVGFDIEKGGLPSIFLMHGTKVHGTPRVAPDRNLYNAIFSNKTKKEVQELQKDVFVNALLKG